MKVVNYKDLRVNLKKWLDSVVNDVEKLIIKRKDNKDLVVISLEEYNSLKETSFLLSGKNRDVFIHSFNQLIKEILRDPNKGIGNPEPLKHDLQGFWSRRIDGEHRLVYLFDSDSLSFVACRYHY